MSWLRPVAHSLLRRGGLALALVLASLAFVACNGGDDDRAAAELVDLTIELDGLTATLSASVTEGDGPVEEVLIAWGDGSQTLLGSGFESISESHRYTDVGDYEVTVTASDASGSGSEQVVRIAPAEGLVATTTPTQTPTPVATGTATAAATPTATPTPTAS
jgi:PKD repeat protein